MELKKTSLYEEHIKLGAKMSPFGDWIMPIQYTRVADEHFSVRNNIGLFDVSHMGEIIITGDQASDFVNYIITNDINSIKDNQICYTCLCYENGGIVDDLLVYRYNNNKFFLVVNANNIKKDFDWIVSNKANYNVNIENVSDNFSQIAVQGKKSEDFLKNFIKDHISVIKYYWFIETQIFGTNIILSRTGYTGEDGFEIYCDNKHSLDIWNRILENGRSFNIRPCGLASRDSLRLEAGLALYGNDIDKDTTPLEAGLNFVVKLNKPNFIAKNILEKQKSNALTKKLVGFKVLDNGIPRHNCKILSHKDETKIGIVTSGMKSFTLNDNIGMGYVNLEHSKISDKILIDIRGKLHLSEIISKPFYKGSVKINKN